VSAMHIKTADSLVGPADWSLPHDADCPGCRIEELEAAVRRILEPGAGYDLSAWKQLRNALRKDSGVPVAEEKPFPTSTAKPVRRKR
jgi:hypothetical protein